MVVILFAAMLPFLITDSNPRHHIWLLYRSVLTGIEDKPETDKKPKEKLYVGSTKKKHKKNRSQHQGYQL